MPPKQKAIKGGNQKVVVKKESVDTPLDEETPLIALLDLQIASIKKIKIQVIKFINFGFVKCDWHPARPPTYFLVGDRRGNQFLID